MPRYEIDFPPDGWQIVRRPEGHYLQQRRDDESWIDVGGPYKQRGSAMDRLLRMHRKLIVEHRKAGDEVVLLPEERRKQRARDLGIEMD